jgi:teichuronic acid biosynthesis glycosyltransferase TuaC
MNKDLLDDRFGRFREIPLFLSQMGHEVIGLCLSYARRNEGWIKDGCVLWKSMNASRLKIRGVIHFLIEALKFAKKSDVIWACSDSLYGVIGCLVGRITKKPVIFDIYDNFGEFYIARLPVMKQLYHWAIRHSDAITCLSKPFAELIRRQYGRSQKIYPIEFAVRSDLFKPLDREQCRETLELPLNALIIGTAGGLYQNRDVDLLIDAFLHLKEKYLDLHLALAGPLDGKLQIPQDSRIHYLGVLPFEKVPFFMNSLNIAVVCYADDEYGKYCFPQKTREFMACDVPAIAARVGSLKELFKDHPQWLYAPGNVQSLIKVIENRFDDRATQYAPPPTWADLAKILESIMLQIYKENEQKISA